jgi:UDP:flavonoid glycosyltransferase YjiC (YdhE family)
MRILMTTRGSAGHLLPLAPIADACTRAGHDVLVAAQRQHQANVERAGMAFSPVGDPPEDEWMPLMARFPELDFDAANALMIGSFFAGIDTRAALDDLLRIVDTWSPDIIVRETWEFASTIAAELRGIPLARVGLGLMSVEQLSIGLAAAAVDEIRTDRGLPADPAGDRLRDAPYLTLMPEQLEDSAGPVAPVVHRFRTAPREAVPPLQDWWPGNDDPLVYLTFGSVAAGAHLPYFPELYRTAIDALAALPVRVLVTTGDGDPDELRPWPPNVHVERWVPQDAIAPHAAAIVCHGGYGTTLGALAHGVPLVVMPLFSVDQWANADAVARAGAGIALTRERRTRRVMSLPGPDTLDELAPAVSRVLADRDHRSAAARVAGAVRALPDVDAAVNVLARTAGTA